MSRSVLYTSTLELAPDVSSYVNHAITFDEPTYTLAMWKYAQKNFGYLPYRIAEVCELREYMAGTTMLELTSWKKNPKHHIILQLLPKEWVINGTVYNLNEDVAKVEQVCATPVAPQKYTIFEPYKDNPFAVTGEPVQVTLEELFK